MLSISLKTISLAADVLGGVWTDEDAVGLKKPDRITSAHKSPRFDDGSSSWATGAHVSPYDGRDNAA
jgi:hypothetical protein